MYPELSLYIAVGYPYGSIVYQLMGPKAPFLILGAATLADGGDYLFIMFPKLKVKENNNIIIETEIHGARVSC